jgi:hypothetical protein
MHPDCGGDGGGEAHPHRARPLRGAARRPGARLERVALKDAQGPTCVRPRSLAR